MDVLPILPCLGVFFWQKKAGLQELVIRAVSEESCGVCLEPGRQGKDCGGGAAASLSCSHCLEVSGADLVSVSGIVELQGDSGLSVPFLSNHSFLQQGVLSVPSAQV